MSLDQSLSNFIIGKKSPKDLGKGDTELVGPEPVTDYGVCICNVLSVVQMVLANGQRY